MKKFILPLLAFCVSSASVAQPIESLPFRNFSTQPVLVFLSYFFPNSKQSSDTLINGTFVAPGLLKEIEPAALDYTVAVCWTSWHNSSGTMHTSDECFQSPFVIVECRHATPDKVIASGSPYGIISSNGPSLSCINTTVNN